jgi:hypothetical protein
VRRRDRSDFADQSALADSRWADDVDGTAEAVCRLLQNRADGVEFPRATNQFRLGTRTWMVLARGQQTPRGNRGVSALDAHKLPIAKVHGVFDEPSRRLAEHHTARWRNRLHSLGHADVLTDGRVTQCAGANFASNHLTGVQADSQLERGSDFSLDVQRSQAGAERVVLQRDWCAKHRHDAVARKLSQRSAVALHHCCRTVEQVSHELA